MTSSARRVSRFLVIGGLAAAGLSTFLGGQVISEYAIPTPGAQPTAIAAGPDGNVWFTEFGSGQVGRITPGGSITEFPLLDPRVGPRGIAAGSDGAMWFSEFSAGRLGRITMSGEVTEWHVAVGPELTAGPDGNLWSYDGKSVLRISMAGAVTSFAVPQATSAGKVTVGPDGNLWFSDYYGGFIGRVTPLGGVTIFGMPDPGDDWPREITAGSDGNLWFSTADSHLWTSTTQGAITRLEGLTVSAGGMALGADGNLWITESPDRIARLTTDARITEFLLPDPSSAPSSIALGPDGNLWFAEYAGNRIGRLTPSAAGACVSDATTLCLGNGRFRVQADWMASTLGRSGRAGAASLTASTGSFWFFDRDSIELVVKMVDGCSVNGREWLFAAGMTNVGVSLVVTDSLTGQGHSYSNADGTPFAPIQDTSAFSTCP
ncbi:MAG TPA: hypothetical protein VMH79_12235 [Thermoanaerobaculia bacterium]|nr:hypothetical protein [Thermoanaerobaculia bacterium]